MGRFVAARQRALQRSPVDRLRRHASALWYAISAVIVAVAIIGHRLSRASTTASSSPAARSTRSRSTPVRGHPGQRRRAARGGRRRRHRGGGQPDRDHVGRRPRSSSRPRSSPPGRATEISTVIIDTVGVGPDDLSPGRRSAPAGARRSPSARCSVWRCSSCWSCSSSGRYFREWKMSVAAMVALAHDVVITIGVYALVRVRGDPGRGHRSAGDPRLLALRHRGRLRQGRARTPRTCEQTRQTYAQAANLAVNQTLVRSINTCIVALIPIGAILYVGARPAGRQLAEGPRARAVRRHGGRRLLLDLPRHPAPGAPEVQRDRGRAGRAARQGPGPPRGRPVRVGAVVHRGHAGRRRGRSDAARRGRRRRRRRRRAEARRRPEPRTRGGRPRPGRPDHRRDRSATARRPAGSSRPGSRSPSAARSSAPA